MAIEIINKIPVKEAVIERVCLNCGVRLRFTRYDTTKRTVKDYTGWSDTETIVVCPNCRAEVAVR